MGNPIRYFMNLIYGRRNGQQQQPVQQLAPAYPANYRHHRDLGNEPPYRSDFYVENNIIGYAGHASHYPTVFFQDGTEFGHIVQRDADIDNLGRELVVDIGDEEMPGARYQIQNELINGRSVAVVRLIPAGGGLEGYFTSRIPPIYVANAPYIDLLSPLISSAYRRGRVRMLSSAIRVFRYNKLKWGENLVT